MTVCMQHPFWNGVSGNPQQTMSLVCKMTFKQIVEILFQCFQKALEQHWNNLFEGNLAELGYVFAYFFHNFFCDLYIIFKINCPGNFQIGILSNKEAIL